MMIYDVNPAEAYEIAKERFGQSNVRKVILPDGCYNRKNTARGKFLEQVSNLDVIVKISSKSQGKARVYCHKNEYEYILKIKKEVE